MFRKRKKYRKKIVFILLTFTYFASLIPSDLDKYTIIADLDPTQKVTDPTDQYPGYC